MFTNQLSTENLRHWLEEKSYNPLQIHWIIYYSQRIDVSPLLNNTFSPNKIRLLGSIIENRLDAEHMLNLKVENSVWDNMAHVVAHYGDLYRIKEKRGNIVVYENHNRVGTYSKKTWDILYELIRKID